jgi:hypothetical protein
MFKVEIFGYHETPKLQANINAWLSARPHIQVVSMTQSESGTLNKDWGVTITILYRDTK